MWSMFQDHDTEIHVIQSLKSLVFVMICNENVKTVSLFNQTGHLIYNERFLK